MQSLDRLSAGGYQACDFDNWSLVCLGSIKQSSRFLKNAAQKLLLIWSRERKMPLVQIQYSIQLKYRINGRLPPPAPSPVMPAKAGIHDFSVSVTK